MTTELYVPLHAGDLRLERLTAAHREALRQVAAADADIWVMYPYSLIGDHFDPEFDTMLQGARQVYAVFDGDALVGCTSWYGHDAANRTVAIGGTFLHPAVRGSGLNLRLKRLMIGHARACGIVRIVFDIDVRNERSQAAVRKLGAKQDGVLRRNKITWTGHVRDTAVYSLLPGEESALLLGA
ncbi:GNAT family N-acetyltransferase [Polymorphobacter fuscus]|uniref:GNAT family N-acetyltransferase n=1 Tax=Sandarakinorhabdus fusca TaxID=1439888 RepID=A0A7C9KXQ3_9SPHN|nr:GNAT family protein [Polymorphobacter fuscus]KAB7644813.1 GNAT family N-acetyltransferase [Polymorphobacter fuscus]MQT18085.1 GNAT family N-acetyltransferase [Polymorphobacter fuscus]NJC09403.1 RimJ/RimL family protein N-acetyltransferase [Polymorphobacter fuscus]